MFLSSLQRFEHVPHVRRGSDNGKTVIHCCLLLFFSQLLWSIFSSSSSSSCAVMEVETVAMQGLAIAVDFVGFAVCSSVIVCARHGGLHYFIDAFHVGQPVTINSCPKVWWLNCSEGSIPPNSTKVIWLLSLNSKIMRTWVKHG